ncbi:MAG: hypothetical protein VXW27_03180, partial [Pseudomonadota bacterium]|nr:hypothetical protein [Pseudomonadota bacterium]
MGSQLRQVSDFVFSLAPSDMPAEASRAAALMCLDTLGVAAAAALGALGVGVAELERRAALAALLAVVLGAPLPKDPAADARVRLH